MDILSYLLGKNAGGAKGLKVEVVETLPQTGESNVLYLVPKQTTETSNVFDEYLYINDAWEKIGTTDIDLSGYVTDEELLQALATKQNTMQYSTMPTASADNLGKIVQYTGATDSTYTNGHFYIVVSDGADPATYSWEEISLGGSGERLIYYWNGKSSSTTPSNIELFQEIIDNYKLGKKMIILSNAQYNGNPDKYPVLCNVYEDSSSRYKILGIVDTRQGYTGGGYKPLNATADIIVNNNIVTNVQQLVPNGFVDFNCLYKDNTTSFTPTAGSYNPATAKYAEDTASATVVADKLTGTSAPTTATVGYVGQQYTDTTNNNQYVCIAIDDTDPEALEYTWVQVNGGGEEKFIINPRQSNEEILEILNKWILKLKEIVNNPITSAVTSDYNLYIAYLGTSNINMFKLNHYITAGSITSGNCTIELYQELPSAGYNASYRSFRVVFSNFEAQSMTQIKDSSMRGVLKYSRYYYNANIFKDALVLSANNSDEFIPTGDYNPSTKLYTDKTHYENMAGYDATKTQVLKNVQGVLQWVDEA